MDSVYRMPGAVGGCDWQLHPLGRFLEAETSPASQLQPNGARLEASWAPHGLYIIIV